MRISLITGLFLFFWSNVLAQLDFSDDNLQQIDSLVMGTMFEKQIPGLAYAILHENEVVHQQTFGFSNLEHQVPVKYETIFELASLTKQFVAVAILQLAERDLLDLDAPMQEYLDSLPDSWKQLSLRQLMSHTAGLAPQEVEWSSLKKGGWPKYVSRRDLWISASRDSIYAEPGARFSYHNTGYFLATTILEKITNQDHRDYFEQNVFNPLQMENTFFEDQTRIVPHLASGYTLKDGQLCKIWRVGQEEIGGGQGLYSNLLDMIRWTRAINADSIISSESRQDMFTDIRLSDGSTFHYGLGWFLPKRNEIQYYYHNGITGPEVLKIPGYHLDIIVLTNLGQGDFDEVNYWGAAHEIATSLLPDFKHQPVAQKVPEELLVLLPARFQYSDGSPFSIENKGEQFYLDDAYGYDELIYIGNHTFVLEENPLYFEFISRDSIRIVDETWQTEMAIRL